jgi:hypothetical protein
LVAEAYLLWRSELTRSAAAEAHTRRNRIEGYPGQIERHHGKGE